MKYSLIHREDEVSVQVTKQFYQLAAEHDLIEDEASPDLIISIGGDGTLLEAFHANKHRLDKVAFLGIHTGHLGFYADWHPGELTTLVHFMSTEPFKTTEYPLLKINIAADNEIFEDLALNEFTIKNIEKTLVMKIKINNDDFEMFRGDGLCVSTPSGSTGYNKSLGGAVIHPKLESIQISEMASINNRVYRTIGSPLLLPQHHHIDLYPQYKGEVGITIDHLHRQIKNIQTIRCKVAEEKIRFARYRPFPFWNRVRDAFIGNHHIK